MDDCIAAVAAFVSGFIPCECLQAGFMQRALLTLLLLAPTVAALGVQVVTLRMAFFADAVSHSAFAGVACGLLLGWQPELAMAAFAVLVGLGILGIQRQGRLTSDTAIGVGFAAAVAFGLAVTSRDRTLANRIPAFLYGDILFIDGWLILAVAGLALAVAVLQLWGFNRLLYLAIDPVLAMVHRVRVRLLQATFTVLLSLTAILAVRAVGVLLVTALLVVPAATGRCLAGSTRGLFWWSQAVAVSSALAGLLISAQDWARTATGSTIVLVSCLWFLVALPVSVWRSRSRD